MAKKTLIISIIVIVIIVAIFATFFLTRNTRDLGNSNSLNSDNPTNEITSEIQQQVSAGAYKNEKYGVEFDYPTNWKISEREVQGDLSVKLFPNSNSNKGSLTISSDVEPFAFCSECNSLDEVKSDMTNSLQGSVQDLNSRELTINGNEAVEITYTTSYSYASKSIYFMKNNKIYSISYLEENQVAEDYKEGYDKIINSFSI